MCWKFLEFFGGFGGFLCFFERICFFRVVKLFVLEKNNENNKIMAIWIQIISLAKRILLYLWIQKNPKDNQEMCKQESNKIGENY